MDAEKEPKGAETQTSPRDAVLAQLAESATDPVHQRLIKAYAGAAPLDAMVAEFAKVLSEVARGEA